MPKSIHVLLGSAIACWCLIGIAMSQNPENEPTFEDMLIDDLEITSEQMQAVGGIGVLVHANLQQKLDEHGKNFMQKIGDKVPKASERESLIRAMSDMQGAIYDAVLDFHDEFKQAAKEVLPEATIKEFEERMFQVNFGTWGNRLVFNEDGTVTNIDYTANNLMCGTYDVLNLTPKQKQEFSQILKEANGEMHELMFDLDVEFREQIQDLQQKLASAQTEEEKTPLREEIKKINDQAQSQTTVLTKKISDKINQKIDKILTDEQKVLKEKLFDEMPDYIWRARDENQGKKRSWRPNINSWMPGQGVPENLENHPGETRPQKKRDDQRRFPGS